MTGSVCLHAEQFCEAVTVSDMIILSAQLLHYYAQDHSHPLFLGWTGQQNGKQGPGVTYAPSVKLPTVSNQIRCALQAGADLAAGSLIKSPGGTIVLGGGYVAGRADLVAAAAARLTAPGVGTDAGCVSGSTLRLMFQGAACDS